MKPTKIDLDKLLKDYKSGWVGISSDFKSVVISGKTLKEVQEKTKEKKEKIYFFPAGQSFADFVG